MISSLLVCRTSRRFHPSAYSELGRAKDVFFKLRLYHSSGVESRDELLPFEWYEKAFPKVKKLTQQLRNVDLIDGTAVCIEDDSVIMNTRVVHKITTLKSIIRVFIGSPLVQQKIKDNMASVGGDVKTNPIACFRKAFERDPMIVDSLTKVGNFLKVSAQQRKLVRVTICPQVTHHRIWTGALLEVLKGLKSEMDGLGYDCSGKGGSIDMGPQIIASCSKFLADADPDFEDDSTSSWMRLAPASKPARSTTSRTWEDVLEMFEDLIKCSSYERELLHHISKLEVMKEGLSQIKDVLIDKGIGYREARLQETLVQKKLSVTIRKGTA